MTYQRFLSKKKCCFFSKPPGFHIAIWVDPRVAANFIPRVGQRPSVEAVPGDHVLGGADSSRRGDGRIGGRASVPAVPEN